MTIKIDKEDLEKALNNVANVSEEKQNKKCKCKNDGSECHCESNMEKGEEIGYHKGALTTLVNERNELIKMAQIVENIMKAHIKRLEELGVEIKEG